MAIDPWSEGIWIIKLADEPAMSDDLNTAGEMLQSTESTPDLVVDFSQITQINSSNLSQLLRIRKVMIDGDARLRLACIDDSIWAIFLTTGLDKVFAFSEDVSTALASLQIDKN